MANVISNIGANPPSIVADNTQKSTVTAVVFDDTTSQPVEGIDVLWKAVEPANELSGTSSTDSEGKATFDITAKDSGSITVTATTADDTVGQDVIITATAVAGNSVVEITTDLQVIPPDGSVPATLSATVHDSDGEPVSDVIVKWSVTPESSEQPPEILPEESTTDGSGIAKTKFLAHRPAIYNVTASIDGGSASQSTILISPTSALPVPIVLNASENDNFTLNEFDLAFGVTALVPYYQNATPGDFIRFHWGDYYVELQVNDPDSELPISIDITNNFPPEALADGIHTVYYHISDAAQNVNISYGRDIRVSDGGNTQATLAAPKVEEADDGYINIKDAIDGVVVEISYDGSDVDDLITYYWNAVDLNGNKIDAAVDSDKAVMPSANGTATVVIPAEKFFFGPEKIGYEGSVDVFYTVLKPESTGAVLLSFSKHCRVDTVSP